MNADPNGTENEFEQRVRTLVREQVDARLGASRPAPRFDAGRASTPPRRRPWLAPLIAAACILAVAVAAILVANLGDGKRTPPASPTPEPKTTEYKGARIPVPAGWTARVLGGQLCLSPAGQRVTDETCPLTLRAFGGKAAIDVDNPSGGIGNGQPCGRAGGPRPAFDGGERTFGGRSAEWRRWVYRCSATKTVRYEQYVVPTLPGFVLYSGFATDRVHAAIATVVSGAVLPRQQDALRVMDRGIVRAVSDISGGKKVVIDRTVGYGDERFNPTRRTYAYYVPQKVFDSGAFNGPIKPGVEVYVRTNGTVPVEIYRD